MEEWESSLLFFQHLGAGHIRPALNVESDILYSFFLSASVLNGTVAFLLMKLGFVGKSFAMLSWQMPSVIGAFFSTMDWKAPILIIVLILLDGILYFPFFKIYEKKMIEMERGEIFDESDGRS